METFHSLLSTAIAQVPALPQHVGVELSGGADSANVALAVAATRDDPVHSFGLAVEGDVGVQQRTRRAILAHRFGLHDIEIEAAHHSPFVPSGVRARGVPHDPTAAFYREAFDAMRDAAAERGVSVMFTGFGGDEINALRPAECDQRSANVEYPPWLGVIAKAALSDIDTNLAPVSFVPLPTLMAFAVHNPSYLEAGIWPVAPLAHPLIGRFAEQLPIDLRRDKKLFRQRLRRAGLPEVVVNPGEPESFSGLMQTGLRRHGLPLLKSMLTESLLVDLGYLDPRALADAYDQALSAEKIPSLLCEAIAMEIGLRSMA